MAIGDPGSGILDPSNPLTYAFGGMSGPTGQLGYEELQRRRAIAQALASQKRPFPKNIGEGLTSLGEAIGDRLTDARLARAEQGYIANAPKLAPGGMPTTVAPTTATPPTATPPTATPPVPAVTAIPASPAVPGTPLTPPMPPMPRPTAGLENPIDAIRNRMAAALNGGPGGAAPNPTLAAGETSPQVSTLDTTGAPGDDGLWSARQNAIGGIESGGRKDPYRTVGVQTKYGRALGRYGVMEANVPRWTQAALGEALTPEQFLANDKAQDAVFKHRFGMYVNNFGEENAARAWFGGPGNINRPNLTDAHERLSIADYGKDYLRRFEKTAGGSPAAGKSPDASTFTAGVASARQVDAGQSLDDSGPPNIESDPGGGGGDTGGDVNPPTPTTIRPMPANKPAPPVSYGTAPPADPRFAIPPDVGPYPIKSEKLTDDEARGWAALNHPIYGRDPNIQERAKALIAAGAERREKEYQRQVDDWKLRYQTREQAARERDKFESQGGRQKLEAELRQKGLEQTEREQEAKLKEQLGGRNVEEFIKDFKPVYADAQKNVTALNNIRGAEEAIKNGAITGYGANFRTNVERIKALTGATSPADVAAQTQLLKTNLDSMISQALQKLQPGDTRVTEGDRVMATGLTGSIEQQRAAILKILAVAKQDAHENINAFEELRHRTVGGHRLEDQFKIRDRPIAPPDAVQHLLGNPNANNRAHFDNTFGPGSAQLEIDRARRRDELAARK